MRHVQNCFKTPRGRSRSRRGDGDSRVWLELGQLVQLG